VQRGESTKQTGVRKCVNCWENNSFLESTAIGRSFWLSGTTSRAAKELTDPARMRRQLLDFLVAPLGGIDLFAVGKVGEQVHVDPFHDPERDPDRTFRPGREGLGTYFDHAVAIVCSCFFSNSQLDRQQKRKKERNVSYWCAIDELLFGGQPLVPSHKYKQHISFRKRKKEERPYPS